MDIGWGDVEARGEFALTKTLGEVQSPNFPDLRLSQLGCAYFVATHISRMVLTALGHHILHVIYLCTQKQMLVFETLRIVTAVKNLKFTWIFSSIQFPGYSMSQIEPFSKPDLTIAFIYCVAKPFPATSRGSPIYFCPKTFDFLLC